VKLSLKLRRLAIIFNAGNAQPVLEMRETEAAARALNIEVLPIIRTPPDAAVIIAVRSSGLKLGVGN
jgi:ABC-type uncharacterized transport system substrate-binding protein